MGNAVAQVTQCRVNELCWPGFNPSSEAVSYKSRAKRLNPTYYACLETKIEDHKLPNTFFRGVSLEFLKEILQENEMYGRANGEGLKTLLTLPKTHEQKCSFAELYTNELGYSSKIGPVRFFVSHAWAYRFSNLVQAIENFEGENPDRAGAYYFIDYFGINQWKPNEELDTLETLIERSEAVVLVLSPLKKPIPMTRCWCLYEIHMAIRHKITIHVTIPDNQRKMLRVLLLTASSSDELSKFEVDSKNAKATKKSDEDMIKNAIEQQVGFASLDFIIYSSVVRCLRSLCFSELENCETQPLRQSLAIQIPTLVHETSLEIKRRKVSVESKFDDSPSTLIERSSSFSFCSSSDSFASIPGKKR